MDSKQADGKNEKDGKVEKSKQENAEPTSDRESSIESFHTNKSEISTAAESELIDVDDIELSDEESWLYKSPRKLSSADKAERTEKWLHNDVEEMNDMELCITKDDLLSKLYLLQMCDSNFEKQTAKENTDTATNKKRQSCDKTESSNSSVKSPSTIGIEMSSFEKMKTDSTDGGNNQHGFNSVKGKENEVLDVTDVHKMAQLQEESLRQSTFRLLNQTEKKNCQSRNNFLMQKGKLSKPASVESLNVCNGKLDSQSVYCLVPIHLSKQQGLFGSASCLHNKQDVHRGSLPNINPGYYSLRSKKSRRPSDQKMPFPLPIYPNHTRLPTNGAEPEAPTHESQCKLSSPLNDYRESQRKLGSPLNNHRESQRRLGSPLNDYRESHTLPSSYRMHSRNHSSSRKDLSSLSPSPRRESTPFLQGSRNSPVPGFTRRESAPCNPPKYLSPMSSPTLHQRSNVFSPALQSPTKSNRNPPQHLRSPPSGRTSSHSPSRRLPLMTVHNRSPNRSNSPASPRNEDFKLASKIPSPGLRSGIPVPSSAYISRINSEESWSHDCF